MIEGYLIMDKQFLNVIILGIAFFLIFTAFQTGDMIQQTVVKTIQNEDPNYTADGFISLCIIYASFAMANWIAPSTVILTGPKLAMVIGGITCSVFIANFLYPLVWLLYALSVVIGVGAAIIWTGQGNFLTINSNNESMSRNSGVFWALFQCNLLFGNLFVSQMFKSETITKDTRLWTYGVLTVSAVLGTLLLFTLRGGGREDVDGHNVNAIEGLVNAYNLLRTSKMALLSTTFIYTGIELSFFSGVYGTAVGNTNNLDVNDGNAKQYIGAVGMLIGAGEIIGGAAFGILGSKTNRYGRDTIALLGYILHMIAFFLIFVNFPANASLEPTNDPAFITSSLTIALACSFLLGLGDACFNTQLYSLLGVVYSNDSAAAFAVFKFMQSMAAAIAFLYSTVINLHYQVLIMALFATIGTVSFSKVEWASHQLPETPTFSPVSIS